MTTHHVLPDGWPFDQVPLRSFVGTERAAPLKNSTTHLSPTLRAIDVNMLLDPGRLKAAFLSNMIEGDALLFRIVVW